MNFFESILVFIRRWRFWILGAGLFIIVCSLLLAWISNSGQDVDGWSSFLLPMGLSGAVLLAGWRLIRSAKPPRWLGYLLLAAAIFRLVLGVVWFLALPRVGYASPAERQGYVMADAYNRDRAAWKIAQRHYPVWKMPAAVRSYRKFDQYGGMLLLSSLIYQVSGANSHQPLMVVTLAASFSAVAILFAWAFSRLAWGDSTARIAAWGLAIYPEAVLLGSSQMREAFLVTLISAAFYYLLRYLKSHTWKNLVGALLALLLCLPFSPPATAFIITMLVLFFAIVGDGFLWKQRKLWVIGAVLVLLVLFGMWFAWNNYAPEGISNPFSLITWWLKTSAGIQARLSRLDSGWVQKILRSVPEWLRIPLLLSYGAVRPFLPAALIDVSSVPIWRWISIWRSVGWTLLLPFLIYAPFLSLRKNSPDQEIPMSIGRGSTLVIWMAILMASLRAGADLWDNPRYRAMFAGLQIALAAWIWVTAVQRRDIWLKRTLISLSLILAWFIPWYLRRYTIISWPVDDFFKTLGLGLASAILYIVWDWVGHQSGPKS